MAIRKNVNSLTTAEKAELVAAIKAVKASGKYNQYVLRHAQAPHTRIHRGPAFLPWHRQFLVEYEKDLQQAAGNPNLGLPYWDWAADSALPNPGSGAVWANDLMGGDGDPNDAGAVKNGPFRQGQWVIVNGSGAAAGALRRTFGVEVATLATPADVDNALNTVPYDASPWSTASSPSFRNRLEGWYGASGPGMHNRGHVWVGGSMLPMTSPNDPVFFLHHCFVDKLWADWQARHPNEQYLPQNGGPAGHNLGDLMEATVSGQVRIADVLNHQMLGYSYDDEAPPARTRDFDVQFYLANNPDLRAAFGTNYTAAIDHWLTQGLPNEGRRGSREFDVRFYLAVNPDLQAAFGTNYRAALDHWVNQGLPNEGRRGSREFDVQGYLAFYADLQAAFGNNYTAAIDHWLTQGLPNEGRRGSREFDVQGYLAFYVDLRAAFGNNYTAAIDHWLTQGLPNEGRRGSREFDVQRYLAFYADLRAAFGNNYTAAVDHWLAQGLPNEGRRGSREFEVRFYLDHYADLKAAFGNNYTAAIDHWLTQGLPNEGRRGSREFDVQRYLAFYADLAAAFGNNYTAAVDHWLAQGLPNEGRRGSQAERSPHMTAES